MNEWWTQPVIGIFKVCIFEQQTRTISLAWKRKRKRLSRGNSTRKAWRQRGATQRSEKTFPRIQRSKWQCLESQLREGSRMGPWSLAPASSSPLLQGNSNARLGNSSCRFNESRRSSLSSGEGHLFLPCQPPMLSSSPDLKDSVKMSMCHQED